jgi:apolipoprotein N-acyltransferase
VVRSANTGISCFINPLGKVFQPLPWDKAGAIKRSIPDSRRGRTFYATSGDIISKIAAGLAIVLALWSIFLIIKRIVYRAKKTVVSK